MTTDIPIVFQHKLKNFKQRSYWDCGITSVLILLDDECCKYFYGNYKEILIEEKINKSTWTIDLCYLLKRFNINHKYLTKTIGINPDFINNNYYNQIITLDKVRVLEKFTNAKEANICIKELSISLNDNYLIKHLFNCGPIILLIDSNLLKCDLCKRKRKDFDFCMPWSCIVSKNYFHNNSNNNEHFSGHYIVLYGFNLNTGKYFYKNPAISDKICTMTFYDMKKARTVYGTDEDIILIYNNK